MRVLLDACVLYPTVMREVLLGVAKAGVFQPFWSERILEEWARAARKIGPEGEPIARGEIAMLGLHWPKASVVPNAGDMARLWLPDEDDVHVLAAGIAASADLILTLNAKDFPRHTLREEGLDRDDPDGFLRRVFDTEQDAVTKAVTQVHATAEQLSGDTLDLRKFLKKARLPRLAKALTVQG